MGEGFPQRPALEHPVLFEAEVIVMRTDKMFLDDKPGIIHWFIQVPVPGSALKRLFSASGMMKVGFILLDNNIA